MEKRDLVVTDINTTESALSSSLTTSSSSLSLSSVECGLPFFSVGASSVRITAPPLSPPNRNKYHPNFFSLIQSSATYLSSLPSLPLLNGMKKRKAGSINDDDTVPSQACGISSPSNSSFSVASTSSLSFIRTKSENVDNDGCEDNNIDKDSLNEEEKDPYQSNNDGSKRRVKVPLNSSFIISSSVNNNLHNDSNDQYFVSGQSAPSVAGVIISSSSSDLPPPKSFSFQSTSTSEIKNSSISSIRRFDSQSCSNVLTSGTSKSSIQSLTPTSALANSFDQFSIQNQQSSISSSVSQAILEDEEEADGEEMNSNSEDVIRQSKSPGTSFLECDEELESEIQLSSVPHVSSDEADDIKVDNEASKESFDSNDGIREPEDNFTSTLDEPTGDSYNSSHSSSSSLLSSNPFSIDSLPIDPHCLSLLHNQQASTIVTMSAILDSLDQDCLTHMYENERLYHPSREYLSDQHHLDNSMRPVLIDWMIEVAQEFGLQRESLELAVNYVDRFLSSTPAKQYKQSNFTSAEIDETLKTPSLPHSTHMSLHLPITRTNLQLLGITCLLIACKLEEIYSPTAHDFATTTDGAYSYRHIDSMERVILQVLEWKLHAITPVAWVKVYLKKICLLIDEEYQQKRLMFQLTIIKKREQNINCEAEEKELMMLTQTFTNTLEYYLNVHLFTRSMEHLDQITLDLHSLTFYPSALAASAILLVYAQTLTPTLITAVSGYSLEVLIAPLSFIEPYTQTPYRGVYNHHIYFPDVPDRIEERYCKQVHFVGAIELLEQQLARRESNKNNPLNGRAGDNFDDDPGSMGMSMISIAAETSMMDTNTSTISEQDGKQIEYEDDDEIEEHSTNTLNIDDNINNNSKNIPPTNSDMNNFNQTRQSSSL